MDQTQAPDEWELVPFRFRASSWDGSELKVAIVPWPRPAFSSKPGASSEQTRVHIVLRGDDGAPFAGRRYQLKVDGKTIEGTTAADGVLDQLVPKGGGKGLLTLLGDHAHPGDLTFELNFGDLPPVSEVSGVQARLNALGFHAGASGNLDEHTTAALKEFQEHYLGHDHATGHLDDETRHQIEKAYATH